MADTKVKIVGIFKDKISKGLGNIGKKLGTVKQKLNNFGKKFGAQLKKAGKAARGLTESLGGLGKRAVVGAAAAVGGLVALTKQATAAGREIKNLAALSNTSVEEFQKMAYGAAQFGITQEKLADQLKDVQDRVGDFISTGGGPLKDFFENIGPKVGVTIEDFKRLSGPEALQLFQSSLEKANLSQSEMTFYLEAMASDLSQLSPLLANNGDLLKKNAAEAEALGIVLSAVDIEMLAQGEQTFQRIGAQIKFVSRLIGLALVPYIDELANLFQDTAKQSGGFGKIVGKVVNFTIKGFAKVGDVLRGIHVVFKGLEVIAWGFGAAVFSAMELITTVIAKSVDGWIMMINEAIKGLNNIPGVSIGLIDTVSDSEFMKGVHEMGDTIRDKVGTARGELHDLAMKPLPSKKVEDFLFNVEKRAEAAAKKAVDLTAAIKATKDAATEEPPKLIDTAEYKKTLEEVRSASTSVATTFFEDIADGSKDAFSNLVDNFKNAIDRMVANALAAKLVEALFGTGGKDQGSVGGSSGFASFAQSLFGREQGGPVQANMPYIVGERRPELFVPRQDGTIIPNMAMAGGGSHVVNVNAIDSKGVADFIESNKFAMASAVTNTVQRYNVR